MSRPPRAVRPLFNIIHYENKTHTHLQPVSKSRPKKYLHILREILTYENIHIGDPYQAEK